MCGLFGGFSTSLSKPEREMVANLGVMNFFRGKDSAGHFDYMVNPPHKEGKCQFNRSTESVLDYVQEEWPDNETRRWGKGSGLKLIAGHARAATKGNITKENAHPFSHGSIVGMHNGTIHGTFENSSKFETDSEALIHNIATRGVEDAIQEMYTSSTSSAYALVWVDCKSETLNFLRNGMRSLSYATSEKDKSTLFWNSEMTPLAYLLNREDPQKWKLFPFEVDKHYQWKIGGGPIGQAVIKELKPKPKVYAMGADFWPSENKGVETVQPGLFRTTSKGSEKLERKYILQYCAARKSDFYKYYDAATGKYFSEWSWKRLSESRMASEMVGSGAASDNTGNTSVGSNDNHSTALNDAPFTNYGSALESLVWTIHGDKIVSYGEWLKATKTGCSYCSKTLVTNSEVFWAGKDPLCVDCCDKATKKETEQNAFFGQWDDEIRKFLRDYPDNYQQELKDHDEALKNPKTDAEYAE